MSLEHVGCVFLQFLVLHAPEDEAAKRAVAIVKPLGRIKIREKIQPADHGKTRVAFYFSTAILAFLSENVFLSPVQGKTPLKLTKS